jgi:hypothetical protein
VAHRGQELALGQHGRLGGLLGLQQLLFQLALAFGGAAQLVAFGGQRAALALQLGQCPVARAARPNSSSAMEAAARATSSATAARQSTALWKSKFRSLPADCTMLPWM